MKCKFICIIFLSIFFAGCTSTPNQEIQYEQLTENEMTEVKILGSVHSNFSIFDLKRKTPSVENVKYTANLRLLDEAKRSYTGQIDIKSVNITQKSMQAKWVSGRIIYEYSYTANGIVIASDMADIN